MSLEGKCETAVYNCLLSADIGQESTNLETNLVGSSHIIGFEKCAADIIHGRGRKEYFLVLYSLLLTDNFGVP